MVTLSEHREPKGLTRPAPHIFFGMKTGTGGDTL